MSDTGQTSIAEAAYRQAIVFVLNNNCVWVYLHPHAI